MKPFDHKGTDRLRRGRASIPGARYFVTVCSAPRKTGLEREEITNALIEVLRALHRSANFPRHCATVMPDHIHLLFALGQNLTLSQSLAKFKIKTVSSLSAVGLVWQENFHDHRLRQETSLESFARYTFLNPYRKQLLSSKETWPGWVLNRNYKPEFTQWLTEVGGPPVQWLEQSHSIQNLIEEDCALDEELE